MNTDVLGLPKLPTVKQWAEAFQVAPLTVYRAINKGDIKAVKVGNSTRICRDITLEQMGYEVGEVANVSAN